MNFNKLAMMIVLAATDLVSLCYGKTLPTEASTSNALTPSALIEVKPAERSKDPPAKSEIEKVLAGRSPRGFQVGVQKQLQVFFAEKKARKAALSSATDVAGTFDNSTPSEPAQQSLAEAEIQKTNDSMQASEHTEEAKKEDKTKQAEGQQFQAEPKKDDTNEEPKSQEVTGDSKEADTEKEDKAESMAADSNTVQATEVVEVKEPEALLEKKTEQEALLKTAVVHCGDKPFLFCRVELGNDDALCIGGVCVSDEEEEGTNEE